MFSTKAILLLALGAVAQAVSATIEPRSGNGMVQAFTDTACKNKKAGSGAVEIGNLPDAKSCIGISDYKSYYAAANPPYDFSPFSPLSLLPPAPYMHFCSQP